MFHSADYPQVQQAIQQFQGHSALYFQATDIIVASARGGYDFSCDIVKLCGHLLDPETNQNELQEYIKNIHSKIAGAHENCLTAVKKFRMVRLGFMKV